jgi:hypothetical protein
MGFMTKVFGSKIAPTNTSTDSHNINKGHARGNTDSAVRSPQNADFSSIRSVPVVTQPRYFTATETGALQNLAKQKREQAQLAQSAYRALRSIDNADTEVHETHRRYQGRLARNEVSKLQANAKLAEQLHGLRPEYERLGQRVETADRNASDAINAIRQTYGA